MRPLAPSRSFNLGHPGAIVANKLMTLTNIPALATRDLMTDSDQGPTSLRFIGRPSQVTFAINANAAGIELEVMSGQRRVIERSAVESGGTAGVYPNLLDKAQNFLAATGEILEFRVRETANVATTDINFVISVEAIA